MSVAAKISLGILLFFIFSSPVFAVSLSFDNLPANIDQNQDVSIHVSLNCSSCGDSYLRGVFYPSGTSYFGFTQDNSGNWINVSGANCTQYFKVASDDLVSGSWSGQLRIKPDSGSSFFNGPGDYLFKMGRYTSGCGSATWSSETTIAVMGPSPTPTFTPSPTAAPTNTSTPKPTSTPTLVLPTVTPTFVPTATKKPTPTIISFTVAPTATITATSAPLNILGAEETLGTQSGSLKPFIISFALIGAGLGLLSIILIWQQRSRFLHSKHPDDIISP